MSDPTRRAPRGTEPRRPLESHSGTATERAGRSSTTWLVPSDAESRAAQRDLVRRGYDTISRAYRTDGGESSTSGSETTANYESWIAELTSRLEPGARVLDIGCGAGVPADRLLVDAGLEVTGIDISPVQIERARALVPEATFVCCDIVDVALESQGFDAVVSLYALIHLPLEDQRDLFPRIRAALRPSGLFLAIVGHGHWTGVEGYLGAPMFWDHADTDTYLRWLRDDGFDVVWHRFVPEGGAGHTLVLARRGGTAISRLTSSCLEVLGCAHRTSPRLSPPIPAKDHRP